MKGRILTNWQVLFISNSFNKSFTGLDKVILGRLALLEWGTGPNPDIKLTFFVNYLYCRGVILFDLCKWQQSGD